MGAQGVIGATFIFALFRLGRRYAGISKPAPIMLGPAIIGAEFNESQIVWNQIGTEKGTVIVYRKDTI